MTVSCDRNPRAFRECGDSGFTLVELLIFSFFSILILALAGGMLISTLKVEEGTRRSLDNSNLDQVISRTISTGVRSASNISAKGELLRARVAVGTKAGEVKWECQAWYHSPSSTRVYWASSASGMVPEPTVGALQTSPWLLLGSGIYSSRDGSGNPEAFFGLIEDTVTWRFSFSPDDNARTLVRNAAKKPSASIAGLGPATCF
jgi:hypothetical protein